MTIREIDIDRTFKEKSSDFLHTTVAGFIILAIVGLASVVIIPIIVILGLMWEYLIEKYWYKWTGKPEKNSQREFNEHYARLPIKVKFDHIFSAEEHVEKIKHKFKLEDTDLEDIDAGQFKTDPVILDIQDKYFDSNSCVFDNKIFVQEVRFSNFKTNIGVIDCKVLTYKTIKSLDSYPSLKFTDKGETLEILLRQPKMKKLLIVSKT